MASRLAFFNTSSCIILCVSLSESITNVSNCDNSLSPFIIPATTFLTSCIVEQYTIQASGFEAYIEGTPFFSVNNTSGFGAVTAKVVLPTPLSP